MAAATCTNCGNFLGVGGHARVDCPAGTAQRENARLNDNLPAYARPNVTSSAGFSSEGFAIATSVLGTMARTDADDPVVDIAGLAALTEEQLQTRVSSGAVSHPNFQAEMGRRMAVAPTANAADGRLLDRMGALVNWSAAVQKTRQPNGPQQDLLSAVHLGFKKGYCQRTLDACYKNLLATEKSDSHAAGAPLTVTRTLNGAVHTISDLDGGIDSGLGQGRFTLVMFVWELFRHILIASGHASEYSLHGFIAWHLRRILSGTPLELLERCFNVLLGKIDQGNATWYNVISLHGIEQLNLLESRRAYSDSTGRGLEGSTPRPGAALDWATKVGKKFASFCPQYNTFDESKKDSCECSRPSCGQTHACNAIGRDGYLCGGDHPSWLHSAKTGGAHRGGRSRGHQ